MAAPHPDDETLGCAGTLLRHRSEGDRIHWLLFTEMRREYGWSPDAILERALEIETVRDRLGFASTTCLGFPPARLDAIPLADIIAKVAEVIEEIAPDVVYVPYRGDAHSDHAVTFDAIAACTKSFRFPSIRRVLAYETLSETDSSLDPGHSGFRPNAFVDVSLYLDDKVAAMRTYRSEFGEFPALAAVRGLASGFAAAEAFMLLTERR